MTKLELINKTENEIIYYIYHSKKVSRDNEVIWALLYENFINGNTNEWADIFILDDKKTYLEKTYLVTIQTELRYYIEYFTTFEEAQRWAIETLQAKANLKLS